MFFLGSFKSVLRYRCAKSAEAELNRITGINDINLPFLSRIGPLTLGEHLISEVILAIQKQNKLDFPICFTAHSLASTLKLVEMIDYLNSIILSKQIQCSDDAVLLKFLVSRAKLVLNYNVELNSSEISGIKMLNEYFIPSRENWGQNIKDKDLSGVYCFKHLNSSNMLIGSALSFTARIRDHMSSFHGHRPSTFFHD